jgi:hypothetical protein
MGNVSIALAGLLLAEAFDPLIHGLLLLETGPQIIFDGSLVLDRCHERAEHLIKFPLVHRHAS